MAKDAESLLNAYDELGHETPFAAESTGEAYDALTSNDYGESPFSEDEQVLEHRTRRTGGPSATGRLVVNEHPLLRSHRGTKPDLILRWNAIEGAPEVDVVVHFHGFSGQKASMRLDRDKESLSGLDFSDPEGSTAGRAQPTLCVLPRGNYYGGNSGIGYNFPELIRPGALQRLVDDALARLAAATGEQRRMGRLIVTGHSGGGAPVNAVLAHTDPDEVHIFDGTYGSMSNVVAWAKRRIGRASGLPSALRVLYIPKSGTQANALAIAKALQPLLATVPALRPFFRVEATPVPHNTIPKRFGWRLLADAGGDLPNARAAGGSVSREAEEEERFDEETGWPNETLESGESLAWLATEAFEQPAAEEEEEREAYADSETLEQLAPAEASYEDLEADEDEDETDRFAAFDSMDGTSEWEQSAEHFESSEDESGEVETAEDESGEDEAPGRFDEQMDERDLEWSLDEQEDEAEQESPLAASGLTTAERKAVEITSTFETGKRGGFFGLSGNFDGQGLSFGLVNWTIGTGSLQPLLRDFAREQPRRWATVFGPHAAIFLRVITPRHSEKEQRRFAVEQMNTRVGRKWTISEPWATYFQRLADDGEFRKIQIRYVRILLKRADEFCRQFGLRSERAFLFMFDAVSSHGQAWLTKKKGGVRRRQQAITEKVQELKARYGEGNVPERDILLMIADVLAATSAARWAAKVRTRKRWFAGGEHPRAKELRGLEPTDDPYTVSGSVPPTREWEEAPTPSAIATVDFDAFGANIARVAEEEFDRWHKTSAGKIRETDAAAVPILQKYYREGVKQNISAAQLRDEGWQRDHPWSAVFVSYVMRTAGAGQTFKYAQAHQQYIAAAKKNRLQGNTASSFWAYRVHEVAPQVGDLVCASRQNSGATYDNIDSGPGRATHCDIVTAVMPGKLRVIGGNVRQNVDEKPVLLRPDGTLRLDGAQSKYFAIVRCRGAVGPVTPGRPAPTPSPRPTPSPAPAPAAPAGKKLTVKQFVDTFAASARRSEQASGVPMLVTLAQAALESGWGERAPGFNFFGIKAKASDPPQTRQLNRTREVHNDRTRKYPEILSITPRPDGKFTYIVKDWFRVYPNAEASFNDHGQFLVRNKRYAKAFTVADNPYAFATEVARSNYATDPGYGKTLHAVMQMIEKKA